MSAGAQFAKPYEVLCHSSERALWLKLRRTGVGASEAAVLIGEQNWGTLYQLWADKSGHDVRDDNRAEELEWGLLLEPVIVAAFSKRTGLPARCDGRLLRSTIVRWALGTLDAWVTDKDGTHPFEVKTTASWNAADWQNGAPRHYWWQCQQQMLVTGASRCYIACLLGGQRLVWDCVERDEIAIRRLVLHGTTFWQRVEGGEAPDVDGHPDTRKAIDAVHGPGVEGESVVLDHDYAVLDEEICERKAQVAALEAEIDVRENQLREAIGRAGEGVIPGRARYTYRTQERRGYTVAPTKFRKLTRLVPKEGV